MPMEKALQTFEDFKYLGVKTNAKTYELLNAHIAGVSEEDEDDAVVGGESEEDACAENPWEAKFKHRAKKVNLRCLRGLEARRIKKEKGKMYRKRKEKSKKVAGNMLILQFKNMPVS
ncbi:hypothetical protein AgCh_035176 [Apium graveolens]